MGVSIKKRCGAFARGSPDTGAQFRSPSAKQGLTISLLAIRSRAKPASARMPTSTPRACSGDPRMSARAFLSVPVGRCRRWPNCGDYTRRTRYEGLVRLRLRAFGEACDDRPLQGCE